MNEEILTIVLFANPVGLSTATTSTGLVIAVFCRDLLLHYDALFFLLGQGVRWSLFRVGLCSWFNWNGFHRNFGFHIPYTLASKRCRVSV